MIDRTVRSELLKLVTARTAAWLLVASVLISAAMAALIAALTSEAELAGEAGARTVLSSGGIAAGTIALMLGIVASAGEYRHGTIAPTLLVTPDRGRVVLAQVIACGIAGLVLGAAAVAVTALIGLLWFDARGVEPAISDAQVAGVLVGGVAFAGLSAALGSALGSLLANPVPAVALALLVLFVLEPLLTGLIGGYQRYSLTGVRTAISGGSAESAGDPDGGLPSFWFASTLWIGYTVALVVAATAAARRREIA